MTLNKIEIENVLKLDAFKRYKYFIKKVADFEELWTLIDEKADFALSAIDNHLFISFWTAEKFIKSNLDNGWKNHTPLKMSLNYFEENVIPVIQENNYLINVFPVDGKSGFIVSANEFIRDLNEELENYE